MATVLETTVAVGILATIAGATLESGAMATRAAANGATRAALQDAGEREMRLALDLLKYQGATPVPAAIATALPVPGASPVRVRISLATSPLANGAISVTIAVSSIADSAQHVTIYGTLDRRAPMPGSLLRAPVLAPAPTGAP